MEILNVLGSYLRPGRKVKMLYLLIIIYWLFVKCVKFYKIIMLVLVTGHFNFLVCSYYDFEK
jgi:hypothetical protein